MQTPSGKQEPKSVFSMGDIQYIPFDRVLRKDGFYIVRDFPDATAQTSTNYGMIFTAINPCEVMVASEIHAIAATTAGSVTLDIEKLTKTTAIGAGTSILATAFDLKGTAYTPVQKSGTLLSSARQLMIGDRLALKTSTATLTSLKGVQITLYIKHLGRGDYR